jgi:hypothetical protein
MTTTAERAGTESPLGLIFLPGFPDGIDVSGNPERLLSGIEMAILTGRPPFEDIKRDLEATSEVHNAFTQERTRILGKQVLVLSPRI